MAGVGSSVARFGTSIDDGRNIGKHDFFFSLYGNLKLRQGQRLVLFVIGLVFSNFHNNMSRWVRTKGTEVLTELFVLGETFAGSKNQGCKVVETVVEMGNRFPFFNRY